MSMGEAERFAYNTGLKQAQWQVTKAMLALSYNDILYAETKRLLKFIHDEIEKEMK